MNDLPLTWNVYVEYFNDKKIKTYNIFNHYSFLQDCIKFAKKRGMKKENFAEEIRKSLQYFFWGKCEWEIILSAWISSKSVPDVKIDVYEQVMLNFDIFIDYLWSHRKELKNCSIT